MRLAAIYLPKGILPHLFGENHDELTINLGGQFHYQIGIIKKNIIITKDSLNKNFIPDFFGEHISLISAIVGRNGIGKTTILRAIHSEGDKRKKKVFYVFESSDESIFYCNELSLKKVVSDFELKEIPTNSLSPVKQYYTPIVDIEQINTLSQLNLVSTGEENLGQLYLKQIRQDVILLNDPVMDTLKSVYPDFPEFKELEIKVTTHRKTDFKSVYASTNLGNQDRESVLKTYIESDIRELDEGKWEWPLDKSFVKEYLLERYINIIKGKGLNSLFDELWDLEEFNSNDQTDRIHSQSNFIKDFEVTLFSYLILTATFPKTPFQGGYDFQKIIIEDSFENRFDGFLELYLANIYEIVKDEIKEKLGRISILDYDQIKKIIKDPKHTRISQQGFKPSDAIKLMKRHLERFKAFFDFYKLLEKFVSEKKFETINGGLLYKIDTHNREDFYNFIDAYNKVLGLTSNYVYRLDLLSIKSTYPLSSGEKALLNFFSRLNSRIDILKNSIHPIFNYYLLLLDEPELGYHPIWKRKFIDAITKSIPILFEKLVPNRNLFDEDSQNLSPLKTQIIFTTHDPLTLSDIPVNNVVFLDKNIDSNRSFIVDNRQHQDLLTFGANVHDLLAHSFFLENGFMGEYAQKTITDLITFLTNQSEEVDSEKIILRRNLTSEMAQKFINIIDEPLIKERIQQLYNQKFPTSDKEQLRKRIKELSDQLKKLEGEEN